MESTQKKLTKVQFKACFNGWQDFCWMRKKELLNALPAKKLCEWNAGLSVFSDRAGPLFQGRVAGS